MRVLIFLMCACDTTAAAPSPPGSPDARVTMPDAAADAIADAPAARLSFQRDVAPLIDHCGTAMCHGTPSWPYAALVDQPAAECTDTPRVIVAPGDPASSYLLAKLHGEGMCTGVRMPKGGAPLADADVERIATWIAQGAQDN